MIVDLQPYPAMKDSGVEWLGEVPVRCRGLAVDGESEGFVLGDDDVG